MDFSYFDDKSITESIIKSGVKKLSQYRALVQDVKNTNDSRRPEYSIVHAKNPAIHDLIDNLKNQFKGVEHLVLVGIGGSNLGVEAVHNVLDVGKVQLHKLDAVSAHEVDLLLRKLKSVRSVKKIVICVVSKSGNTTETLVNGGVLLSAFENRFSKEIYKQTIFIGNPNTTFFRTGKRLGVKTISMPEVVGGRYSVATEIGLVPLALLGHDTDSFISGLLDSSNEEFESIVASNASRICSYISKGYEHYNFFAFEPRLYALGAWYRQLISESLGKENTRSNKKITGGFITTISTPAELHSVGQLYFSCILKVYTDFVTFDESISNYNIPKSGIAKIYSRFKMQDVAEAICGGVINAYQNKLLPYRSTVLSGNLSYSLGVFMGMRMLETMYMAELLDINAFDQPNVELYKSKTRDILGI